ncbi:MAG: phosphoribosylformylglycinamidine synthase subunit PurQ, partial [Clostridia bacterium]|nr:phosphoribosylformylglycinamidine synthase subunit PurQ [Clostridia bacterium]
VTAEPRLKMRWNGKTIVDISREFLNSNGAEKHVDITPAKPKNYRKATPESFSAGYKALVNDLNVCSKRGLSERFDSTIGAGAVLMPFGGKYQLTPAQAMVTKISVEKKHTDACSFMAWGYNPFISEKSPYHGAYLAVVESISKLIATGADDKDIYLTFQEYFEKPNRDGKRWGKPLSALLGAFKAQLDFGYGAIGGKDSMSGSFEDLDVPPTLVSFAVTTGKTDEVISNEYKGAGHKVVLVKPEYDANDLPQIDSLKECYKKVTALMREGKVYSASTVTYGGIAECVIKSCMGNGVGFKYADSVSLDDMFAYNYGAFLLETDDEIVGEIIGYTTDENTLEYKGEKLCLACLYKDYEGKLESVYPVAEKPAKTLENFSFSATDRVAPAIKVAKPKVLIPVFPGTNCEFDSAKVMLDAGADAEIFVINNLSASGISRSVDEFAKKLKTAQMVFVPGGFSGGDEPDGSGKFIMAFFRGDAVKSEVHELLNNRDGLMCGICNGFQALIKLGLVPYGKIIEPDANAPTLTFNTIARHQSKIVRVRVASNKSPWLAQTQVGDIYNVAISHGEGRFLASDEVIRSLVQSGQVATQYVDLDGNATDDIRFNPNGSICAIEGITSPDGRVFGKMGHSERIGKGLYKNVYGEYDMKMFESAVKYFK